MTSGVFELSSFGFYEMQTVEEVFNYLLVIAFDWFLVDEYYNVGFT